MPCDENCRKAGMCPRCWVIVFEDSPVVSLMKQAGVEVNLTNYCLWNWLGERTPETLSGEELAELPSCLQEDADDEVGIEVAIESEP